ncbi:EamA family transporter RarD [Brevibacterium litoralis]|uniref:EamA family transporter RarD n=1 Tax=Brevibacterium litoralis TaxID=3138935 RepID=UPI0032EB5DD1
MTRTPSSPSPTHTDSSATGLPADELARRRAGLVLGLGCYALWGFLPLVFQATAPAPSIEVLAHRILWSLVFTGILLVVARGFGSLRIALRDRRLVLTLGFASLLVGANWLVFLFGVEIGRVVDVSLGYFINPLITVLVGVFVLKDRLRPLQWTAMGIGTVAVLVISIGMGEVPWISLLLAGTFAFYGYIKSRVGGRVGALQSLMIETMWLTPIALTYVIVLAALGQGHFGTHGQWHTIVMLCLGPVTAIPLILFAGASSRVPLSWMGMMQYVAPTTQFIIGVTLLGEEMPPERWAGFFIVWLAIVVLTTDGVIAGRKKRRSDRATRAGGAAD